MDPGGDELRLQIVIRYRQADHAALSQALVIRPRVCHLLPGLPALTQFARFIPALYGIIQAGFIMLRFYTTRSIFAIPPSGQSNGDAPVALFKAAECIAEIALMQAHESDSQEGWSVDGDSL